MEVRGGKAMLKKFTIYLILFGALIMISDYGIDYTIAKQIDNKSPYYLSFASIGANSLESRMDCWATIRTSSSTSELEKYLNEIANSLSLPIDEDKFVVYTTGNSTSINYETANEHIKGYFVFESDVDKNETYFVISLVTNDKKISLHNYENNFNRMLGVNWKYYYLYTACLDYLVADESKEELLKVINKKLKTENIETYKDKNIISMAGFSPVIAKNVQHQTTLNKKSYNVQIAARNNVNERKTYIYIGSPLILGDY